MKAELKRDGFKNSYKNEIDKIVAKELGLSDRTIFNWKSELGQTNPHHNHNKQKELMKRYYEIKDKKPKMSDESIVKMLKISRATLCTWKSQFKRQQFHPNSVDGLSVEENAAANKKHRHCYRLEMGVDQEVKSIADQRNFQPKYKRATEFEDFEQNVDANEKKEN
uniref:Transposase n=1 Tax=Globodera rostochiensis TaxID=31243 RepID=A0A914HRJ6_GLORO